MNIDANVVYGVDVIIVNWNSATSTAATTLDIYADLFDDDLEAVAVALHDAKLSENVGTGRRAERLLTRRIDHDK